MTADKVVGLTAGADDYLVKPFDTLGAGGPGALDAAAQPGVPRGLAADRAARQQPHPARDRRPGPQRRPTTRSATSTSTGSRASTTRTASPAATSSSRALARSLHRAVDRGRPAPGVPRPRRRRRLRGGLHARSRCGRSPSRRSSTSRRPPTRCTTPTDAERGYIEVVEPPRRVAAGEPGDAVDRRGAVDRPGVVRPARGRRGRLGDEDGRQEVPRLLRRVRPARRGRALRPRARQPPRAWRRAGTSARPVWPPGGAGAPVPAVAAAPAAGIRIGSPPPLNATPAPLAPGRGAAARARAERPEQQPATRRRVTPLASRPPWQRPVDAVTNIAGDPARCVRLAAVNPPRALAGSVQFRTGGDPADRPTSPRPGRIHRPVDPV